MSKVLVIEDEPALLESFVEVVSCLGHECLAAPDGARGLDLARQHQPDLVITDHMMPGKTGGEVIRALRVDPALSRVPVILLSAARLPESVRRDAWLFLSKPVPLPRLELALNEGLALSARANKESAAAPPGGANALTLAREEMLSWVAHEIKSPLSAAVTANELALRSVQGGDEAASLERRLMVIARQLRRVDELVNSLLDAAQLQDGRLELSCEPLDLADAAASALSYWKDLHAEVRFDLRLEARPSVRADPARLRQIFDNLLSNAVKYGGPADLVGVVVSVDEARARVSVTDRGGGIPREQLAHIFDRFRRIPGQGGRGHGLGLYIAAALARLHGGLLDVQSEVGHGSTFTLTLPLDGF